VLIDDPEYVDPAFVESRPPEKYNLSAGRETYQDRLKSSGEKITKLVIEKNLAYGDAVNKVTDIVKILFPDGISPDQYKDMLLLVRDLDKTCRIANGDPTAFDENPWQDKAGYAICGMAQGRRR